MGENHKDYQYKYTKKGKKILLKAQSKWKYSCWSDDGPTSSHPGHPDTPQVGIRGQSVAGGSRNSSPQFSFLNIPCA